MARFDHNARLDSGLRFDTPDPLPAPISPRNKPKNRTQMAHQPYLPKDENGINDLLVALDTNLPGALATKYEVTAEQLFRLHQGRLVYGWFLDSLEGARAWSESMTNARDRMQDDAPGDFDPLPGLPVLAAAPTIVPVGGPPAVPVQLEPGFFDFLGRLVQQIKSSELYDSNDGVLLKIVGAEVAPPAEDIQPTVKHKFAPSGRPVTVVKKTPFQGYDVKVSRGGAPAVAAGFATAREYEIPLALPPAGTAEVWTVQVQYRYRNAPFGQWSQPLEMTVRGM